jgi:hypothetical protein
MQKRHFDLILVASKGRRPFWLHPKADHFHSGCTSKGRRPPVTRRGISIRSIGTATYCARCSHSWLQVPTVRLYVCTYSFLWIGGWLKSMPMHKQSRNKPLARVIDFSLWFQSSSYMLIYQWQVPYPCRSSTPTRTRHRWLALHLLPPWCHAELHCTTHGNMESHSDGSWGRVIPKFH